MQSDEDGKNTVGPNNNAHQENHGEPFFYEHKKEIEELVRDITEKSERPRLIEISGQPLLGKYRFAIQLAEELRKLHIPDLQVNSTQTVNPILVTRGQSYEDVFRNMVSATFADPCREEILEDDFLQELHDMTKKQTLIVCRLDNVQVNCKPKVLGLVQDMVESSTMLTIVMTTRTRCQFPRLSNNIYINYTLHPVGNEDAKLYLQSFVGDDYHWSYIMDRVVNLCGGYPRLLKEVGNRLCKGFKDSDIRQLMEEHPFNILPETERCRYECQFKEFVKKLPGHSVRQDLSEVITIRGSFGLEAFSAITGTMRSAAFFKRDMRSAFASNILATVDKDESFIMGNIMRCVLEDQFGYLRDEDRNRNRFCAFYAKLLKEISPLVLGRFRTHLPSFLSQLKNMEKLIKQAMYSLHEDYNLFVSIGYHAQELIANYLQRREVVNFYENCVQAARERKQNRRLAQMLTALSHSVMELTDDFQKVEDFLTEARDLYDRIEEGETLGRARLLATFGWYWYKMGKHSKAIRVYHRAKNMLEGRMRSESGSLPYDSSVVPQNAESDETTGMQQWVLSSILSNIAINYTCVAKFDKAVEYHQRNLKLQLSMWGECHPHTATTNHRLALSFHLSGDSAKAFSRYALKGLDLRRHIVQGPSVTLVHSLSMAAVGILNHRGDAARSLALLNEGMEMRRELGILHPDTALLHNSFGNVYRHCKDYAKACKHYRQAVEIRSVVFKGVGPNCCTGESLDLLGDTYLDLGDLEQALETQENCLRMRLIYLADNEKSSHANQQGGAVSLALTACQKIGTIWEQKGDSGKATFWQSINDIQSIPREFFP